MWQKTFKYSKKAVDYVLGLKLGAKIKDIECTRKSYPNFVSDLRRISGI